MDMRGNFMRYKRHFSEHFIENLYKDDIKNKTHKDPIKAILYLDELFEVKYEDNKLECEWFKITNQQF